MSVNFLFLNREPGRGRGGGGKGTSLQEVNEDVPKLGSLFHDWIDYYRVTFSRGLLECGLHFLIFGGKTVFHIYG